jgi:hypothetical protein
LYGKNDATPEELNRALELSNAHSFINNLPDGLDTQVIMLQQYLNINKLPKCFLIMCNNLKISLWLRLWKQRQSL